MKNTPWLAMTMSEIKNKTINTSTKTFHTALVDAILEGFVSVPSTAYNELKKVFEVINTAIETRASVSDNIQQYIFSQRYEYSPATKTIRSFIRTSMFEITQEMVEVHKKKSTSTSINAAIAYSEYEAQFNMDDWAVAFDMIE
ncbi:364f033d-6362-4fa4-a8ae-f7c9077b382a [Sclerotinia trifoliorum]|uniref:364f033d-6362-4fa4-a8ae-f7c9077b382a n=1 Tax=Sclerotinia trifoliorum TaxID=28548 RepID=A0A8H2ZPT6_9HELO|nr:364f033d-6362-4fa4-a8ae-f7c9077b382a [Sclerotinia trifoliorum]